MAAASARGTTTTPLPSMTTTSPGDTATPAHWIGTLTSPYPAMAPTLGTMPLQTTGKRMRRISSTSRQAPSTTAAMTPRLSADIVMFSPQKAVLMSGGRSYRTSSPGWSSGGITLITASP